ncbi:hypothetical protein NQ314_008592 [Rhamnusium bicolor]|uniref:RING-type domain-containing protein n=1 Tax=Rhamnusium bicolor TaxID=1586634 RepID=A0AAV8YAL4_9CUCU|nr:hypothetical protein NQ314_008592 [Rhamnusium bicolor]
MTASIHAVKISQNTTIEDTPFIKEEIMDMPVLLYPKEDETNLNDSIRNYLLWQRTPERPSKRNTERMPYVITSTADKMQTNLEKEKNKVEATATDFVTKLRAEMECPICLEYMSPPIRQCENSHSICSFCFNKVAACPICRQKKVRTRCQALEQISVKLIIPCKYKPKGCTVSVWNTDREQHEMSCPYTDENRFLLFFKRQMIEGIHSSLNQTSVEQMDVNLKMTPLAELKCSVCLEYMMPPFYQCESSHTICDKYFKTVLKCTTYSQKEKLERNVMPWSTLIFCLKQWLLILKHNSVQKWNAQYAWSICMSPPIRQFENSHSICSFCFDKVAACPICRQRKVRTRCQALEQKS